MVINDAISESFSNATTSIRDGFSERRRRLTDCRCVTYYYLAYLLIIRDGSWTSESTARSIRPLGAPVGPHAAIEKIIVLPSGRNRLFKPVPTNELIHEEKFIDLTMISVLTALRQLCRIQLNKHFKLRHSFLTYRQQMSFDTRSTTRCLV